MDSKGWLARLATVAMMVAMVACAQKEEETQANIEVETETAPPAPMTITLQPVGGAAVRGEAIATHFPDKVNIRLTANGLTEGPDYEAKLKYGTCSMAQAHFDTSKDITDVIEDADPMTHEPGEEFGEIEVTVTAPTGFGSIDLDPGNLRTDEDAYLVLEIDDDLGDDDALLACADLRGHGDMGGTTGTAPTPGTEPAPPAP